jgi:hypothetical protein
MDVSLTPGRPHNTEARAGPRRSELDWEVLRRFAGVLANGGWPRSDSGRRLHSE